MRRDLFHDVFHDVLNLWNSLPPPVRELLVALGQAQLKDLLKILILHYFPELRTQLSDEQLDLLIDGILKGSGMLWRWLRPELRRLEPVARRLVAKLRPTAQRPALPPAERL